MTKASKYVAPVALLAIAGAIVAVALMFSGPPAEAQGAATCRGQQATIAGSAGSDDIEGTNGRDVIVGRGGHDELDGNGGRDLICGGGGNDDLAGDWGNDRIYGGPGFDEVDGDEGRDLCRKVEERESCER
jgi:Ca2+-binding RTX toxin-like protein